LRFSFNLRLSDPTRESPQAVLLAAAVIAAALLLGVLANPGTARQVGIDQPEPGCTDVFGGLTARVKPSRASVRPGQTTRFIVAVSNERAGCTVDSGFIGVRVQVRMRPGAVRDLKRPDFRSIEPLAYGETGRTRVPVKARTHATGRYRLRFRISEQAERASIPQARVTTVLRVDNG
jgi:hypothetical protein